MAKHASHQFLRGALLQWIVSFSKQPTDSVEQLADGVLLGEVAQIIYPESFSHSEMLSSCKDTHSKLHNLSTVMNHLIYFSQTHLRSVLTLELPDLFLIASEPSSSKGMDELEKLILMILGIGVECENRAPLIENMKNLSLENQETLVNLISEVTKNCMHPLEFDDTKDDLNISSLFAALSKISEERMQYYQLVQDSKQLVPSFKKSPDRPSHLILNSSNLNTDYPEPPPTPGTLSEIQSENSSLRRRINQIQAAADERLDLFEELQKELQTAENSLDKLNTEKRELLREAQSVSALKTELDAMRDKANRLDRVESENARMREKLEDLDYYKKQVSDLKQQKVLHEDTRVNLEERTASLTAKLKSYQDMGTDYTRLKGQLDSLSQEKEMDMTQIRELLEKNTQLEIEYQNLLSERQGELDSSFGTQQSLQSELTETEATLRAQLSLKERELGEVRGAKEQLSQAQCTNRELERTNLKMTTQQNTARKENMRLKEEVELLKVKASRVDRLEIEVSEGKARALEADSYRQRLKEYRQRSEQMLESKALLEEELSSMRSKMEQLSEQQQEVYSLRAQLDSLNEERQADLDTVHDLMKQNAQLELERQSYLEQVPPNSPKERPKTPLTPLESPFSPCRPTEAEMILRAKVLRLEREAREGEKASEALRHAQAQNEENQKAKKRLTSQSQNAKLEIASLKEEVETYKQRTEKMELMRNKLKICEQKLTEMERIRATNQEIKNENMQLFEAKAILQEEVTALTARTQKMSFLQSENAMFKVKLDTLEQERQEELHKMNQLLETNFKIDMDRHQIKDQLELLEDSFTQMGPKSPTPNTQSPRSPVRSPGERAELKEERERNQSAILEMQSISRKMATQASEDKALINQLKEEVKREKLRVLESQSELAASRNDLEDLKRENENLSQQLESQDSRRTPLDMRYEETYTDTIRHKEERIRVLETRLEEALFQMNALKEQNISLRKNVSSSQPNLRMAEMSFSSLVQHSAETSPRRLPQRTQSIISATYYARMREERDRASRGRYTPSPDQDSPLPVRRAPEGHEPSPDSKKPEGSNRLKEQVRSLKQDNKVLVSDLLDANQLVSEIQTDLSRNRDRSEMLEALNRTLEEENKTLLAQTNRLLIQNQDLMMRTLESKDIMIEEERIYNDRLGELEDDKSRLFQQLESHKREILSEQIRALKEKRKGSIVKRGAHAIGKRLKNIKKRQDEEEDRDRGSTGGSYAPSRIGSYALESPALFPQDMSELGADVTPVSLLSEGSGVTEGNEVKKQSSFRRRRWSSGKSHTGGSASSITGLNTTTGGDMLSLSDFLHEQQKTPGSRKSDSGSGSQRSDQLTPSQLNSNSNNNNNNNNKGDSQLLPRLGYIRSEADLLASVSHESDCRASNSTFILPERSPTQRDPRMTSSPNSTYKNKQSVPISRPHRRLVMTSQLRNSKYPFPSEHALSCSDLLEVVSQDSSRSQTSFASESGSGNHSRSPGRPTAAKPAFSKRHSVATGQQTSNQPKVTPITRTYSQGNAATFGESEIDQCSVLKSVSDLFPDTAGFLSDLGVTLPSQIINKQTEAESLELNTSDNDSSFYSEFGYI